MGVTDRRDRQTDGQTDIYIYIYIVDILLLFETSSKDILIFSKWVQLVLFVLFFRERVV